MDASILGQYIRTKRTERGLTQKELAKALSVSDKAVSKWECGRGIPDYECMIQLSRLFDVSVDDMLTDFDDRNGKTVKKSSNYTVWCFVSFVLTVACFLNILLYIKPYNVISLVSLIDIPTFGIILIGIQVVSIITKKERRYFLTLNSIFRNQLVLSDEEYKKGVDSVIIRIIGSITVSVFLFIVRYIVSRKYVTTVYDYHTDPVYILLPFLYMIIFELFYVFTLLAYKHMYSHTSHIKMRLYTVATIIVLALMMLLNMEQKNTSLFSNGHLTVDLKKTNGDNYAIVQVTELPQVQGIVIPEDRLEVDETYFFNGETYIDKDDGVSYVEYESLKELMETMNITLINSEENTGKCAYIKSTNKKSDEINCSDVYFAGSRISEKIYFNASNDYSGTFYNLSEIIPTVDVPETSSITLDGIEYYFVYSENINVAYVYDGKTWYKFKTEGDKDTIYDYVMTFTRRLS